MAISLRRIQSTLSWVIVINISGCATPAASVKFNCIGILKAPLCEGESSSDSAYSNVHVARIAPYPHCAVHRRSRIDSYRG